MKKPAGKSADIADRLISSFFMVCLLFLFTHSSGSEQCPDLEAGINFYRQKTLQVKELYCENRIDPHGIEILSPRFSWTMESRKRNRLQSAYRILVASNRENLDNDKGDIWDSGKIGSGQSILVRYQGSKLAPATKYYWKVRVWDQEGNESDWSKPGTWQMSLLTPGDWQGAKWIGYRQLLFITMTWFYSLRWRGYWENMWSRSITVRGLLWNRFQITT